VWWIWRYAWEQHVSLTGTRPHNGIHVDWEPLRVRQTEVDKCQRD
jgi:hypothetical protein